MWKTAFKIFEVIWCACGRQPLKKLKWYGVMRQTSNITSNFLKVVFHKFYLVHSWILCPIYNSGVQFHKMNIYPTQEIIKGCLSGKYCKHWVFFRPSITWNFLFNLFAGFIFQNSLNLPELVVNELKKTLRKYYPICIVVFYLSQFNVNNLGVYN